VRPYLTLPDELDSEMARAVHFERARVSGRVWILPGSDRRVEEGKTDPDVCRVIWKTPLYADYNWTAHPELEFMFGEGFTDRLQQALVQIDDPLLLAALPRNRLIPARNEEFEGIREVAEKLGMLR